MTDEERAATSEVFRAAFMGEVTIDEAADRLHAMGVREIGIRSAIVKMPEGHQN